jgi:hypothetical protein
MPLYASIASGNPVPSDFGLTAWTFDATISAASGGILAANGGVYGGSVFVRATQTISTVYFGLTVSAATLTASQNGIGIWSAAGTLVAKTGDLKATFEAAAGAKSAALSAVTSLTLAPGMYWVGAWANGTTLPTLIRCQQIVPALVNFNLAAAVARYGTLATGVTTTPTDITPGSIVLGGGNGLYYFAIG